MTQKTKTQGDMGSLLEKVYELAGINGHTLHLFLVNKELTFAKTYCYICFKEVEVRTDRKIQVTGEVATQRCRKECSLESV